MDSFNSNHATSSNVAQNNHPSSPHPCPHACGFFGSPENHGLCSKCYADYKWVQHMQWLRETSNVAPSAAAPPVVPKKNRCGCCNKKVGLLGFTCRCGGTFCGSHRYAESHTCSYDFKAVGKLTIEKENPVVVANKLQDRA